MIRLDKKIFWLTSVVEKYARSRGKSGTQAFKEMYEFGSYDFIEKHYDTERLLSFEDVIKNINDINPQDSIGNKAAGEHLTEKELQENKFEYLKSTLIAAVVQAISENEHLDLKKSFAKFYNSPVAKKLDDEKTGLYLKNPAYLHELYRKM